MWYFIHERIYLFNFHPVYFFSPSSRQLRECTLNTFSKTIHVTTAFFFRASQVLQSNTCVFVRYAFTCVYTYLQRYTSAGSQNVFHTECVRRLNVLLYTPHGIYYRNGGGIPHISYTLYYRGVFQVFAARVRPSPQQPESIVVKIIKIYTI